MGFFQDLKEDLSQAVTELIPDDTNGIDDVLQEMDEDIATEVENEEENEDLKVIEEFDTKQSEELSMLDSLLEEMEEQKEEELLEEDGEALQVENIIESQNNYNNGSTDSSLNDYKSEKNLDRGDYKMDDFMNQSVSDETAIITAGMNIKGDITSQGSLDVIGQVNGNINILGKLNITGTINGNSTAAEVFADSAKIVGEVNSLGSVKLGPSSVIIGNIVATSAVIAGAIKGDIDVKGPVVLDVSAIVMGNIKSKSVQINNGAVIEGLCSQCYADVSPTAFFDDIDQ